MASLKSNWIIVKLLQNITSEEDKIDAFSAVLIENR